jgi:hypothetical protein
MGDDALRARILARRAALVAATLAAVANNECSTKAAACLSLPALDDAAAPMPCLSAPPPPPRDAEAAPLTVDDAGVVHLPPMPIGEDAGAAPPSPCLSVVAPHGPPAPPPRPCLTVAPPRPVPVPKPPRRPVP